MIEKENVPIRSLLIPEHSDALERLLLEELEQQKLNALAEFAAGIGHEFNNPLAVINGRAQMLLRDISNPEHQKHLASIMAQVRRAYEMIADIRLFARPPQPEPVEVNVSNLLREVVTRFESDSCEQQSETTNKINRWDLHNISDDIQLFVDPKFLELIFSALFKNAVEAAANTSREGLIKLSCEYGTKKQSLFFDKTDSRQFESPQVVVTIEDNGPGIAPEHFPLLFSPYFSGRQAGRGLGFGLCKARRLLDLMGGTITAENCTPNGVTFVVTLRDMQRD